MVDPATAYTEIEDEVSTVLVGNEDVLEQLTIALLTDGHVLVEGAPGVAKTTAAKLFARVLGLDYRRLQMTPDMLPADITGTHVYRHSTERSELVRGPIFSNVVLADEINRGTPKTQSALLEAMEEGNVTIEGETLSLPDPFVVVATQNSIEMDGTFELPKAQLDRFQLKISMTSPDRDVEREILDRSSARGSLSPETVTPVLTREEIMDLREEVRSVHVAEPIKEYILDIVTAVRENEHVSTGASPRASIAFLRTGQARAAIHGRGYVVPDDIKTLLEPVLAHRVELTAEAHVSDRAATDVLWDVLMDVRTPSETMKPEVDT